MFQTKSFLKTLNYISWQNSIARKYLQYMQIAYYKSLVVNSDQPHIHCTGVRTTQTAHHTQNSKKSTPAQLTTQFFWPVINKKIVKKNFLILFYKIWFLE